MTSLDVLPCPVLRPYIQVIWCLEIDPAVEAFPPERISPDSVVELVFHYRDPMAMRFAGEEPVVQPRSSAVTLTRRFVEISPRGSAGLLSVRFRPWGAHHFLALPVCELADQLIPVEDLWGTASCRELEERLAAASNMARRVALVEEFLLGRLQTQRKVEVEPLVRAVWRRGGNVRVADLCAELGLGERTLERMFATAVGMPPSSFIRLNRFLHACTRLRRGGWTSLTRLAHDCGYYDQAHFIADVKAFSGMTPRELVAAPVFSFLVPD
jgi:AraC-like DNA-binding protein